MNIIRRLEVLEAAASKTKDDVGIGVVFLKTDESSEEGIIRSGFQDWPRDRIVCVNFVKPNNKPICK
jgi:hypothetical protein